MRAADRTRDVTLRLALGASRWRIVRQLLVESSMLAAAGGLCGFVLGYVGIELFFNLSPDMAPLLGAVHDGSCRVRLCGPGT